MPMRSGPVRFIVLSSPRSGSTWFVDTLNRAPDVAAYGELFQPGRVKGFTWGALGFPSYVVYRRERRGRTGAYLHELFAARADARAVGFKLMYGHATRHPQVMVHLRRHGVRVVHLVRANSVDVALSRAFIAARSYGHATAEAPAEPLQLRVDPPALLADVRAHRRAIRAARAALRLTGTPHLEVTYEALCDAPAAELERVGRFLGLDAPPTVGGSPLRKVSARQGEGVTNAAEVHRALTEAGYGHLLRGAW